MATDQRRAFAAEIAGIARRHKDSGRAEAITKTGHTVLLTGMWGEHVGAIVITDPHGHEVRRADGWKVGKTADVAELLWDGCRSWSRVWRWPGWTSPAPACAPGWPSRAGA